MHPKNSIAIAFTFLECAGTFPLKIYIKIFNYRTNISRKENNSGAPRAPVGPKRAEHHG